MSNPFRCNKDEGRQRAWTSMRLGRDGGQIGWNPHFSLVRLSLFVIGHSLGPPRPALPLCRQKNCKDKIFYITALPSSFLVSQTQILSYAHCIPSYVAIAKFSLPFFSAAAADLQPTLSYMQGSYYWSQIRPFTTGLPLTRYGLATEIRPGDPAVARRRSRLTKSCYTARGVAICNEGRRVLL
jgi:hypothetical protein